VRSDERSVTTASYRMNPLIQTTLRDRIERQEFEIPALNDVVLRLISLCSDGDHELDAVVDLVSRDQSLAGHVLSVANSVAYSPLVAVASIGEAVKRLGARTIVDLCISMVVREQVFRSKGPRSELLLGLWKRASLAGVFSQRIGQLQRGPHELALLVGLLHDIGEPILVRMVEELEWDLGCKLPLRNLRGLLEPLHQEVGGMVIRRWGLPEELEQAALHHHDSVAGWSATQSAALAQLADTLAGWTLEPESRGEQRLAELPAVAELGLDPARLGGLFADRERIREIAAAQA
jgi:HD-like signal output (HDOD) protein